jgi:hypothetical protein
MSTPGQASASAPRPTKIPRLRPPHSWAQGKKTEIQGIQRDINTALKSAFNPHPSQYQRAIVVFFHFSNDDLDVAPLELRLEKVFNKRYGFTTRRVLLQQNPRLEFTNVINWLDNQGYTNQGNLIILVFSGHGELAKNSKGHTYLRVG